ncbi:MAG: methyltransferase domain-containing protein [Deltaproteobacteria bacterium]|nr:methyltransferase domain-containing protein [Deltaproteobacteria bacterium]
MVHTPEVSETRPPGAGKSSFDLIEPARLLSELPLKPGITFLDLGCGAGNYTMAVAEVIGAHGVVVALDLWPPGIETLEERAMATGRRNIRAVLADISKTIPLGDHSVDVCLMATVLHDLVEFAMEKGALEETARVLKPGGVLAIVEFDKVEAPPGPPLRIRLTPQEVETLVVPYGFQKTRTARVGPFNYLILFIKK